MDEFTLDDYIEMNRHTFDHHSDIILIKDADLRYAYVNQAYIDKSLNDVEDIIGHTNEKIHESDRVERYQSRDRQVLERMRPINYKETMDTTEGKGIPYLVTKAPIFDNRGEVIGILASGRNISNRVRIRNQLQDNLNLIETLMDTIPYPIFIKDLNGIYIKINQPFADELDMTKEAVIGNDDIELFGSQSGSFYQETDQKCISTGERQIYISERSNSGSSLTTKDVLRNRNQKVIGVVGIINPYLDIEEIQQELINKQKIDSLSHLAGGIAHDLNNMLTNIVGVSGLLLMEETDPVDRDRLETVHNSSLQASQLIDKLRTFAVTSEIEHKEVNLSTIVSDITRLISTNHDDQYQIEQVYSDNPLMVRGDRTQLSQMVMNLLINAIEAMEQGGSLTIECSRVMITDKKTSFLFHPSNYTGGTYAKLTIQDTGPGIDSQSLMSVFDPFYTTKEEGSGLGLSIVYGVISSHNGLLRVNSEPEMGTTFEVFIPLVSDMS